MRRGFPGQSLSCVPTLTSGFARGDFGRYVCAFAPPEQSDVEELCWPRAADGNLLSVGNIVVGRLCVMGEDAAGWMAFLWQGLEVLLLALASWAVIRMWF